VPFFDASVELLPIAAARYASPDEIPSAAVFQLGRQERESEPSFRQPLAH
jgi:hypothetical protein